jgi:hypothetical protein
MPAFIAEDWFSDGQVAPRRELGDVLDQNRRLIGGQD